MTVTPGLHARIHAQVGPLAIDVDVDTGPGTLVVVGPNGAGKSSLLSLILGVLPLARARIEVGDAVLVDTDEGIDVPVEARRLGYVPQDYALFPHLNVRGNVAFALRSAAAAGSHQGADERIDAVLRDLGISALAARLPRALSGGERQRVALARALSVKPRALLLDEPLAALDIGGRRVVRTFLADTLREMALPAVVITHDPADAKALGQRIAVLEAGRCTQIGTWQELVVRPASRFVEELVAAA